jgi:hypothetical protein
LSLVSTPVKSRWTIPLIHDDEVTNQFFATDINSEYYDLNKFIMKFKHSKNPIILSLNIQSINRTVGAKSITRFFLKYVFLRQNISGHRHGRELCFFFIDRSLPGKLYRGEES